MDNQHRKITGYRELNQDEIDQVNQIKEKGKELEVLVTHVKDTGGDPRWAAIAATHLQEGLMALTRSVTKPEFF